MIEYHKHINLPQIPENILDELSVIETYENVFPYPEDAHTYASYRAPKVLSQWVQQFFDYKVNTRYQVIKQQLPVHVDYVLTGIKYNYLLDTGGNVYTRWWNAVDDPKEIVHEIKLEPYVWHSLNISKPHDISCPESPRISVVIENVKAGVTQG